MTARDMAEGKAGEWTAVKDLLRALEKAADRLEQASRWMPNENDRAVMKDAEESARRTIAKARGAA